VGNRQIDQKIVEESFIAETKRMSSYKTRNHEHQRLHQDEEKTESDKWEHEPARDTNDETAGVRQA
jgi:hypothetical protein